MEFTKEDHEAVRQRYARRKRRTCGQIVCVLAQSSSDYAYIPILWASVLSLFCSVAVDRFYAMERAADFPVATNSLCRSGLPLFVVTVALRAYSAIRYNAPERTEPPSSSSSSAG